MKMNRRNALIGLGALAVGGGAAFGSGAFSQVSADRTVNIEAAGDAAALLGIGPASSNTRYVRTANGTFQIDLDGSELGSASGINYDAMTFIEPLFQITNNGAETVGIRIGSSSGTDGSVTVNTSASSENGDGTTNTINAFDNSGMFFNFYAAATGDLTGSNTFGASLSNNQTNCLVADSFGAGNYADVDLTPDASVEVALAIDTLAVDSSTVSANTELLNEVSIVASADDA